MALQAQAGGLLRHKNSELRVILLKVAAYKEISTYSFK